MNLVKQVTSTMGADKKELLRQKTEAAEAAAKEAEEATARAERLAKEVKELAEQLKSSGKKTKATKSVVSDDEQKKADQRLREFAHEYLPFRNVRSLGK